MSPRANPHNNIDQNTLLIDIATRNVVRLAPSDSVGVAARIMSDKRISSIVVTDEVGHPEGIVTERNMLHAMQSGFQPETELRNLMSSPVVTVPQSITCLDAYHISMQDGIRHLVIVDENKLLVGLVSETDFRLHINLAALAGRRQVTSAMSRSVSSLAPEANLLDALNLMQSHRDTCVLVVEEGRPVGIVTERDIVRLYSNNPQQTGTLLREVMASPVIAISLNHTINEAAERMLTAKVRHLAVVDNTGRLVGLISEHDLTHNMTLNLLDEKLIAEGAYLQTLLKTIPDMVWLKDLNGVYLACNPRLERFFGASENEIIGNTDYDFVDKNIADNFRTRDLAAIKNDAAVTDEEWVTFADDGHRELLEIITTPMRHKQGKLIGVLGIARDITERKLIEEQHRRLSAVLMQSNEPVTLVDENGCYVYANPAYCKLFGYELDELTGKSTSLVIPQDKDSGLATPQIIASAKEQGVFQGEVKRRTKGGTVIPLLLKVSPFQNEQDEQIGYVATMTDLTEIKRIEKKLLDDAMLSQTILNSISEGLHGINRDGEIIFENHAATTMLGWKLHEMIGQPAHATMHHTRADGSTYPQKECHIYATLNDGVTRHIQDEVFWRKDGTSFPVDYTSTPLRNATGEITGTIVLFRDITDRKLAEEMLRKLSVAVEQSPASVIITDLKASIQYVNPRFTEITGYSPVEVIGKNPRIFKSGQMSKELYLEMWGKLSRGIAWHGELLNKRKNGEIFWEETHIAPVKSSSGNVTHYVAVKSDVTERKRQEIQLFESEQRLLNILNVSPIAVRISVKRDRQVVFYNPRYADLIKNPDAMGIDPERFYARASDYEEILDELAHGKNVINRQIELSIPDGSKVWALASYMPMQYHGEEAVMGWFYDITQLKQTEQALRHARHKAEAASLAKSEFLANMSHEIRTPMNAILGMAEILSESELTSEQRKYVGIFRNAGNNLLNLINDILDMSKVEAGQLELDKTDYSLEQVLDDLVDLHAIPAFDKGLELVLDIKPGVPEFVHGDAKRLKQCLTNLVGNAIKFSPKGAIVLRVRPSEASPDWLEFSVSDNGIGIPAEKHETIFEAFSQADSSTTRRFGGTGLGLTITRRLVGLMEGKIWVKSQEGKGSTFFFTAYLPQSTQPVHTDISVDMRNLKVLVVDDHAINRTIVRQYLQPLGAEVFEAESAVQALVMIEEAAVKREPFSLALVDTPVSEMGNQVQKMNALDMIAQVRADPAMAGLKIMILSSSDTAQQRLRARELEVTFLLKPIKRHELILSIGRELQPNAHISPKTAAPLLSALAPQDGLNILLAEDNPDNVLLIEVYLKQTSHHIDKAENGLVAVEKFRSNRYDVILMDVQMPIMGGYEATAEIRRIEKAEGRVPTVIFALTAHALKEDEQRSIDAGCSGHLTKPIKKKVLLETLSSIQASA